MGVSFAGWTAGGSAGLAEGPRRLSAKTGESWVCFDGRLFNGGEVAAEALLLANYARWGDEFPQRLQGEYAFALWDAPRRRLLLGRDSTGYRALYYATRNGEFRFATDVKALLEWPDMPCALDESHVAQWLSLTQGQTDSTFFKGIQRVRPGHTLAFENGRLTSSCFFNPANAPEIRLRDSREYADGLVAVLDKAVADRIDAGRHIGAQLSGGLDSTSVTSLAAAHLSRRGARLAAFTAAPANPDDIARAASLHPGRFCDESAHARSVAQMFPNIEHIVLPNTSHPMFGILDMLSTTGRQPVFTPQNCIWLYEICRLARLRGIDTLLAASLGNITMSYNGQFALASLIAKGRWADARRLSAALQCSRRSIFKQAVFPFLPFWLTSAVERLRAGPRRGVSLARPAFLNAHGLDRSSLERAGHAREARTFRSFLLSRRDGGVPAAAYWRATGVWRTDPTGDPRVVQFCLGIPPEQYCQGGVPRSLIRDAMQGRISELVRTERRSGLQAADFLLHLHAELPELKQELKRAKRSDLLVRALDLPLMEEMADWPEDKIHSHGWGSYLSRLLRAVSLARFVRHVEDGTLFKPWAAAEAG